MIEVGILIGSADHWSRGTECIYGEQVVDRVTAQPSARIYTTKERGILVESELVEKDVTPLVVVPERFEQRSRGLWSRVGHTARGEERRRGLDTWKEAGEHLLRGRCCGDDNLWRCRGDHGSWDVEEIWALGG